MQIALVDLAIYAIPAVVGALVGWSIRKSIAASKETALKRAVLDAKASVPILESSVRKGDQRAATLEAQVSDLKNREREVNELLEQQRNEAALKERQLRNANSELTVLRSGADTDSNLYMDESDAPASGDSDLVARATRAEERYESLKRGLIERDDRILALEEELKAKLEGGTSDPKAPAQLDALEAAKADLQVQLDGRDETIKKLNQRLEDEAERREVLESLAKGRGEAKLEQRAKLAGLEEELPALRKTLAESEAMITQRVATIASLRDQLDTLERDKANAESSVVELTGSLAERDTAIAEHDTVMNTMLRTLEVHKGQIETLTQRNAHTDEALRAAEQRVAERDADIAAREASTGEVQGTIESLKGSLRDRDFKIETLESELNRVTKQLGTSRTELEQSSTERGQDVARLETQSRKAVEQVTDLQQAKEQLEGRVSAFESAAEADRQRREENDRALTDRDLKMNALESKLRDAQGQIDALAKERANAEAALQAREAARADSKGTPDPDGSSGISAGAPAGAAAADRDLKINALENKLRDAQGQIDALAKERANAEAALQAREAARADSNGTPDPDGSSGISAGAAAADSLLRDAEQRINTLENSIKDRDFRIDSLMQDAAALEAKLEVSRAEDQPEDQREADPASAAATHEATR